MRQSISKRKISLGLLQETYRLAKEIGTKKACKQAGISTSSLRHYALIKHGKKSAVRSSKYCHLQKYDCFLMAHVLKKQGFSKSMRKCWIEAGNRLGMKGRSVEFQYIRGLWKPTL